MRSAQSNMEHISVQMLHQVGRVAGLSNDVLFANVALSTIGVDIAKMEPHF